MALKDISWGSVILGAAAVSAFVAFAPVVGGVSMLTAALEAFETAASATTIAATTMGTAAVVGGIAGEFVSDLFGRAKDAGQAIVR